MTLLLGQALILQAADALVAEINATFTQSAGFSFQAQRTYFQQYQLSDLDDAKVNVYPTEEDADVQSREDERQLYYLNVTIQQKVDPTDNGQMDPLVNLVDAIYQHYRVDKTEIAGLSGVRLVQKLKKPFFNPKFLATNRLFFSNTVFVFRQWVDDSVAV